MEDVLRTHVRDYKVRLIPLTIVGLRKFAALNQALGLGEDSLYLFEIEGGEVPDPRMADEEDSCTAGQATLSMLANEPGHSFTYCYDLDCDRACTVVIEEIAAVDPTDNEVIIIGGAS